MVGGGLEQRRFANELLSDHQREVETLGDEPQKFSLQLARQGHADKIRHDVTVLLSLVRV